MGFCLVLKQNGIGLSEGGKTVGCPSALSLCKLIAFYSPLLALSEQPGLRAKATKAS